MVYWLVYGILPISGLIIYFITHNIEFLLIVLFVYGAIYLMGEIYKLTLGNKIVDNSKGIARYLFGDDDFLGQPRFSPRESLITAKKEKNFVSGIVFCWF